MDSRLSSRRRSRTHIQPTPATAWSTETGCHLDSGRASRRMGTYVLDPLSDRFSITEPRMTRSTSKTWESWRRSFRSSVLLSLGKWQRRHATSCWCKSHLARAPPPEWIDTTGSQDALPSALQFDCSGYSARWRMWQRGRPFLRGGWLIRRSVLQRSERSRSSSPRVAGGSRGQL